jgi:hypothetical protein
LTGRELPARSGAGASRYVPCAGGAHWHEITRIPTPATPAGGLHLAPRCEGPKEPV